MKTIKAMLPYIKSISPAESIVASTLLLFCEGLNVTGKIFLMMTEASAIPVDNKIW